jgi:L-fuculose-phosphate aldolase
MNYFEKIVKTAQKMMVLGLVKGTWGNISTKENDRIYITPSGKPYDALKPEEVAVIDLNSGEQINGGPKPSSELPLHLQIYKNFPNLNGIVHTHSTYASTFAAINKPIPCYIEDQAQIIGGEILVAKYAFPGTKELADNAVEALKDGIFGILLSNHGAVGVGRNLEEAMIAAQIIEKSAEIALLIKTSGEIGKTLSKEEIKEMRNIYLNKYSTNIIKQ